MLELKVRRIGSSLGVLLPKAKLDAAGVREGDIVMLPRIAPRGRRELYGVWKRRPVRLEFEGA